MLFPTGAFALFFAVVFVVHWTLVRRAPALHKAWLLAANLAFYSVFSTTLCALLVALGLVAWALGPRVAPGAPRARAWLWLGVAIALAWLGYFKYANFLIQEVAARLADVFGLGPPALLEILLPVGISFYCFQAISYLVDVHRGAVPAARGPLDVLVYLTFFPHLSAGPIVRAAHFLPQLATPPDPRRIPVLMALILILGGLFKKMILANEIGVGIVDPVFRNPGAYGTVDTALAIYGYAIQIWCDFSAYSDMAIGIAALLGYHFPKNFDQPYRANSLADFWHRWHISLSRFLRDYLYIPLGGSRFGSVATMRNLFLTMLLGGIWHGAAWTFVLWGALHGAALAVERALGRGLGWFLTFHVVVALFALFRAPDLGSLAAMASGLLNWSIGPEQATPWLALLCALGLGLHFLPPDLRQRVEAALRRWPAPALGLAAGIVLVLILRTGPEGVAPFIYFQF
ncbi:MAG: MBOAT family protein [Pseudomonadota bacterium]